ncbi:hypothetical protein COCC4DRAFT_75224 [Bipolaris maydis ATCC 48331]|uniref:Extracellular membrane protein CFEM domain-containing protein n=2 Tax=Cochliobolus heterostrophus TaxID=5016 RepID=M2V390_COCH5|nr:uncharacterized protein COCC4DRAFT_75224 [Bipolaris maydis ATCC 48331]EMD94457.1 hypothetical protein COCHEDRAFT_1222939 [Bipolaris maydis C5]KAH7563778.1 hypothetical protein BM1_00825 [Bipolaris maydis]ENI01202.1 hypothetical protein COCC4DRAFT_75224 [Bipolaris maydis ATCC 48331]KAJ5026402.1 hypothetical protein J3E73DRAFT_423187 [Bipolaris maydis]KAJ5059876.1 hypothetical protein J3E74DRAFT_273242 [Bipolaris maydis]
MKYSTVLLFAIGASAQSITSTSASSAPASTALSSAVQCAMACEAGDVNCQAACLGNARPNASQVIETNECAAKCDQGDGSPSATEAYSKCVDTCITDHFPSSQTAFVDSPAGAGAAAPSDAPSSAAAGTGANSATPTPTGSESSPSGSPSGSHSGSASGSAGRPSSTAAAGAADKTSVQFFGAGLAGLLAVFAL